MDEQKINSIDLLNEVDATIMAICKKVQDGKFVFEENCSDTVLALAELLKARAKMVI